MCSATEDIKRSAIRKTIELKREIERASLDAVEILMESGITEDTLTVQCRNLWQQSFQDLTEERALTLLCGYPLCDNAVKPRSGKMPQHRICTRTNKVYSMEQRRDFCSPFCQKASQHIKGQLCEVPLWMSDVGPVEKVDVLRRGAPRPSPNVDDMEEDVKTIETKMQEVQIHAPSSQKRPAADDSADLISVDYLEKSLCELITISTIHLILGQDEFLKIRAEYDHGLTPARLSTDEYLAKYMEICASLDRQEKLEGIDYDDTESPSEEGKREARAKKPRNTRKRVAFKKEKPPDMEETEEKAVVFEPILPPVAKHDKRFLRKQIFIERISPTMNEILGEEGALELTKEVAEMVDTFLLTSENCCVRQKFAPVICAVLLMLIDRKKGSEGMLAESVGMRLGDSIRLIGLSYGDIKMSLRRATDPKRLFS